MDINNNSAKTFKYIRIKEHGHQPILKLDIMVTTSSEIIKSLLPTLKLAANYAATIQEKIQTQPEKSEYGDNFYATALTDADLTVQTAVELALLAQFPQIRFFGEEYQKSFNTKYFTGITMEDDDQILVTLDPIDGTRTYIDQLPCFSIILTIIKNRSYQAVLILQPKRQKYFYAERNQGSFVGSLDTPLEEAEPLRLQQLKSEKVYLSFGLKSMGDALVKGKFSTYCSATDYAPPQLPPESLNLIEGDLAAVVLEVGNLIDSAAMAFVAKEAGAIVTNWQGQDFEPFVEVEKMKIPGLVVAANSEIHQRILEIIS